MVFVGFLFVFVFLSKKKILIYGFKNIYFFNRDHLHLEFYSAPLIVHLNSFNVIKIY